MVAGRPVDPAARAPHSGEVELAVVDAHHSFGGDATGEGDLLFKAVLVQRGEDRVDVDADRVLVPGGVDLEAVALASEPELRIPGRGDEGGRQVVGDVGGERYGLRQIVGFEAACEDLLRIRLREAPQDLVAAAEDQMFQVVFVDQVQIDPGRPILRASRPGCLVAGLPAPGHVGTGVCVGTESRGHLLDMPRQQVPSRQPGAGAGRKGDAHDADQGVGDVGWRGPGGPARPQRCLRRLLVVADAVSVQELVEDGVGVHQCVPYALVHCPRARRHPRQEPHAEVRVLWCVGELHLQAQQRSLLRCAGHRQIGERTQAVGTAVHHSVQCLAHPLHEHLDLPGRHPDRVQVDSLTQRQDPVPRPAPGVADHGPLAGGGQSPHRRSRVGSPGIPGPPRHVLECRGLAERLPSVGHDLARAPGLGDRVQCAAGREARVVGGDVLG